MIPFVPWGPNPRGAPTFVLDAEVTVRWRVPAPRVWYPSAVLSRMTRATAAVPECWFLNVADHIAACVRSKQLTAAEAALFFTGLHSFAIWVDDETLFRAWREAFDLARAHDLRLDSAAYLELALRLNLPLATADATLARAAGAAGAPTFTP